MRTARRGAGLPQRTRCSTSRLALTLLFLAAAQGGRGELVVMGARTAWFGLPADGWAAARAAGRC